MPETALNTSWQDANGNDYVAYLNNWNGKRKLNLNIVENDWNDNCRFLAFRN